jgi:NTE family protein
MGGGGVRGMAHVPALEVIDDCGIRPTAVSGTSMGAIVGALYASGMSGKAIRTIVDEHIVGKDDDFKEVLSKAPKLLKWMNVVSPEFRRGGMLKADGFLRYLIEQIGFETFEELEIPLYVVTTDFWSGEPAVISSGELLPAIKASMAIPGVFAPVVIDEAVLVDGGVANNLPYDVISDLCDITIAIDVAPTRRPRKKQIPNVLDSVLGMFDMMVENAVADKIERLPPTVYCRPEILGVRTLDFDHIEDVYEMAKPAVSALRGDLQEYIDKKD